MMGLSVYWDLTEVAAHAEYTGDWEAIELPLEMFFQRGMSEDQILAGRENWFKSTADLTLRTRAGACAAIHASLPVTSVHAGEPSHAATVNA